MSNGHTVLTFIIAGSDTGCCDMIKNAFPANGTEANLVHTYFSSQSFLNEISSHTDADFIAADQVVYEALERSGQTLDYPLVLFSKKDLVYEQFVNPVFDTVVLPASPARIENLIKKISLFKSHFKKDNDQPARSVVHKTFLIKKGRDFQPVSTQDVVAFFSDSKITYAADLSGNKFMITATLAELEQQLQQADFFRVNRQYLINRKYLSRISPADQGRFNIILGAEKEICFSISYKNFGRLKDWIEQ